MKVSLKVMMLVAAMSSAGTVAASDFNLAIAALRDGRPTEGASIFHKLAVAGDADAMFNLALLYHQGVGLPQSPEDALYWAWRARLDAQAKGQALAERLLPSATREQQGKVYQRLMQETQETANAQAPISFVKIALIEQSLAAKPSQIEIYATSAMAVALGYSRASSLRDAAAMSLSAKDTAKAEQRLLELYGNWCAEQPSAPTICASIAAENKQP